MVDEEQFINNFLNSFKRCFSDHYLKLNKIGLYVKFSSQIYSLRQLILDLINSIL